MSLIRHIHPKRVLEKLPIFLFGIFFGGLLFRRDGALDNHPVYEYYPDEPHAPRIPPQDLQHIDEINRKVKLLREQVKQNLTSDMQVIKASPQIDHIDNNPQDNDGNKFQQEADKDVDIRLEIPENRNKQIDDKDKVSISNETNNTEAVYGRDVPKECPWADSEFEKFKCVLPKDFYEKNGKFDKMLRSRADRLSQVFLASVDSAYVDMAKNLVETSFYRHHITNFLFVCSDEIAMKELKKIRVDCYLFEQEAKKSVKVSRYMSKEFVMKTHIKTKIILGALSLGYTVILTDVDIVFLSNPLPHFTCTSCDIEIQSDHTEENSGFYLVRPTKPGIILHDIALQIGARSNKTSNQKALNAALKSMKRHNEIKVKTLEKDKFPCGMYYFERPKRLFADQNKACPECVIVHNNWIMGKLAKIYRFKEHLMWSVDVTNYTTKYYSSIRRKYLMYDNPIDFGNQSRTMEIDALKMAMSIGHILKRTVILPDFTCIGCKATICKDQPRCPLNAHIKISSFHNTFLDSYREHMFLSHPKVPKSVKSSISDTLYITSSTLLPHMNSSEPAPNTVCQPEDPDKGATVEEILKCFGTNTFKKYQILKFHSLYNSFSGFGKDKRYASISKTLKNGIIKSNYRQY